MEEIINSLKSEISSISSTNEALQINLDNALNKINLLNDQLNDYNYTIESQQKEIKKYFEEVKFLKNNQGKLSGTFEIKNGQINIPNFDENEYLKITETLQNTKVKLKDAAVKYKLLQSKYKEIEERKDTLEKELEAIKSDQNSNKEELIALYDRFCI